METLFPIRFWFSFLGLVLAQRMFPRLLSVQRWVGGPACRLQRQLGQDAQDRAGLTQGGAPLFIILQTHVQLVLCAR